LLSLDNWLTPLSHNIDLGCKNKREVKSSMNNNPCPIIYILIQSYERQHKLKLLANKRNAFIERDVILEKKALNKRKSL